MNGGKFVPTTTHLQDRLLPIPRRAPKLKLLISIIVLCAADLFSVTFITIIDGMDPEHEHVDQKRAAQCDCCYEAVSTKGSLCLSTCKHIYCPGCVSIMFSNATKNEASFPPKCCGQEISLTEAACCLHRPQIKSFEQSAREFNTPIASRRYCANPKCSSFLGRGNRDILRCNRCTNLTCNGCLRYAHPGQCLVDHEPKHLELLGKLAKEEGWQQCSACGSFLDKSGGCNHITCPCSHQFCYVCGAGWKTCGCPQFDEGDGRFRDVHPPFGHLVAWPIRGHHRDELIDRATERLLAAIRE